MVGWGGLAGTGGELFYGKGLSWVALLVSEGRGEPVPGWFIGGPREKTRANCVLYS